MRLDRYLSASGLLSRKEAAVAARAGRILLNGTPVRRVDMHIDEERDRVTLDGAEISYRQYEYIWLNKPAGYVSATEDRSLPYVTELLSPVLQKKGLFPCGRLDRDTLGLMLLTNDGDLSHRLLSPRHHVEKVYAFRCAPPLPEGAEDRFLSGMTIGGEECKPAVLVCDEGRASGRITLTEGKYHQVKRMTEALGSRITYLERISFAGIPLDPALARGEYREATEEEIKRLRSADD